MEIIIKIEDNKRILYTEAKVESIPQLTECIETFLDENNVSMKIQMQMNIVVDEIFSNIAKYAFDDISGVAKIVCEYSETNKEIVLVFEDNGKQYNPLEIENPDVSLPVEERTIGGLGLFVVKKIMDSAEYTYKNGYNIFKVIKKIP
ncbi:ATP-binding protein [Chakrabartyella piscis]|uniref:ATP-binding protein n=1 Tax=Chakrabartyella piscis TaxID=2918914 RepID=UPI002958DE97|nr:ATP-binding protein [Chakrabartyella piscis]